MPTFDDFRVMAKDPTLSRCEKVGFPDSYRHGKHGDILLDILAKLTNLSKEGQRVLDIGCGCDYLQELIADKCKVNKHVLTVVDSAEMLDLVVDQPFITKVPGMFPHVVLPIVEYDAILAYSVIQYFDGFPARFASCAVDHLAVGGQFLIGDIPNLDMHRRFRTTEAGKGFSPTDSWMDDTTVLEIVSYFRFMGCHTFILPQGDNLPMANRREDILIVRPG